MNRDEESVERSAVKEEGWWGWVAKGGGWSKEDESHL